MQVNFSLEIIYFLADHNTSAQNTWKTDLTASYAKQNLLVKVSIHSKHIREVCEIIKHVSC